MLVAADVEVMLQPSDLIVSGRPLEAAHARAILTEHLVFTKAYMTWDKEANEMEDRLRAIWEDARRRGEGATSATERERLADAECDLRALKVPFEEWEVLFREKLIIERSLLRAAAGITEGPASPAEVGQEQAATAEPGPVPNGLRLALPPIIATAIALIVVAWRGLIDRRLARR
jgi:hypothetical protein